MKWFIVLLVAWLMVLSIFAWGNSARADEFTDRLDRFERDTKSIKKTDCGCGCGCANECGGDCSICPRCIARKKAKEKEQPKKLLKFPGIPYKHTCGCNNPNSSVCNCAELGGCHCSENTQFNRVNPRWVKDGNHYGLFRGEVQYGCLTPVGAYYPLINDEWCEPTLPPIPLPGFQPQQMRQQSQAEPATARRG